MILHFDWPFKINQRNNKPIQNWSKNLEKHFIVESVHFINTYIANDIIERKASSLTSY